MGDRHFLSKSKLASFEQCPKRLWLETHRRELAEVSERTRASFQVGHQVGEIACAAYPDGVMIAPDGDLTAALEATTRHLAEPPRPLFEATLSFEDVLVRIDLLIPEAGGWRLAEVKSTGGVKAYQLGDIATQLWVAQGCGLDITATSIRHIDTHFVYRAHGDYAGLLTDTDVHDLIAERVVSRFDVVQAARATLEADEPPIEPGDHCTDPFDCPFSGYCSRDLPPAPAFPVMLLPGTAGKSAARRLLEAGFTDLRDVPPEHEEVAGFRRIYDATRNGAEHHDAESFSSALQAWGWPRYYLDFETISFAVPRWLGARPYQGLPFQFSCHIETEAGEVTSAGFLDLSGDDPSEACAEALIQHLGTSGPVITYNAAFERGCILDLARRLPHLAKPLRTLADRIVDLLPLVRAHYYHPQMRGSWSIKSVLPARIPALSYKDLAVQDGLAAQDAYMAAIAPDCAPERKAEIHAELEAYCGLDTWAMVELARSLSQRAAT